MLPYRRLFKYRMGRYRGLYEISSKYRLIIRYSIYRSIAIPSSIDIERSQVSRYFNISSIEPHYGRRHLYVYSADPAASDAFSHMPPTGWVARRTDAYTHARTDRQTQQIKVCCRRRAAPEPHNINPKSQYDRANKIK